MSKLPIAVAVATLVSACTFQPKYERPAPPVASSFPQSGVYATQPRMAPGQQGANGVAAADIGWREFFNDPRLQRLIELSLNNNRDLAVAVLKVQQAAAQYRVTRADLFPTLDAVGSETKTRTPRNLSSFDRTISNQYSVGLSASWEIDFWGRLRSLKDQALAQYLATAQARKAAEILLVSQVADQYLTVLAADEQLALTQRTLDTANASYNLAKLQFDTGTGSELDLHQSQGIVEQARANLQAQQRLRAQAENALVLLVGQPLPEDLPAGLPLNAQSLLADIPAGLPSDLLMRRPDVMEAEQRLLAANANIGAARAAFFPNISLTGNFGTLSPTLGGLFKPGSAAWGFTPKIDLPIFEGGLNVANLQLADVGKKIAIAQYEKAIQIAFREVADGLAARGTYDQQIQSLDRYVASQQRRLELSELRYRNGVDSYLNVLTAQTDLYGAQQSLISARLNRLTNLVDLYQYLGGGWLQHTGDTPRPADALATLGAASAPVAASASAG
ncbi:efflux transporter outer membrane subunit [Mycetohabitans sp. B5]|nr:MULTISPECIES: efflux transporter outer membrane subunit [Mycetohabitans]MCG1055601.1 efflux transporter outer membrane subunit [Mycetohabitans sp. B5]